LQEKVIRIISEKKVYAYDDKGQLISETSNVAVEETTTVAEKEGK